MAEDKFGTAEELEALSPAERTEIVRAGLVTDLSEVPESLLERVRSNVRDHIASAGTAATTQR